MNFFLAQIYNCFSIFKNNAYKKFDYKFFAKPYFTFLGYTQF
jgi:hypothetical protein